MSRILITGGSGALGPVIAATFQAAGHAVALVGGRRPIQVPNGILALAGRDLTDAGAAALVVGEAVDGLGGIDVLVNAAGAFSWSTVADADPALWTHLYGANLLTCLNMCRAALVQLPTGGRIVNIGAAAAARAGLGMGPYAASKAAVARLTEALAAECAGRGIGVNAVLPAILDTPGNRAAMPDADPSAWTSPAAVADAIAFLSSHAARAISGALMEVTAAA